MHRRYASIRLAIITALLLGAVGFGSAPGAPNVPTLLDLGYKDFVLENVYSLLAPKGTPRLVIDKLNALMRRAMGEPSFRDVLLGQGVVPEPSMPDELKSAIQQDYEWNASMARRFNIRQID